MSQLDLFASEEVVHAAVDADAGSWDFGSADTRGLTHGFHPWPAKFIPQIPARLIDELTGPGDVVFDPFCGSGTSLVEAVIRGRRAWGNDINPLAALISKVKATPLTPRSMLIPLRVSAEAKSLYERNAPLPTELVPKAPRLDYWFHSHVIHELALIKSVIGTLTDEDAADFSRIAMSAIIVGVSNQDSETRYSRVPKNIVPGETIRRFEKKTLSMLEGMTRLVAQGKLGEARVTAEDAQTLPSYPNHEVSAAVFSPPYLNAFDYHLYHRFRLFWLDMDPVALRRTEIGAHLKYEPDETNYKAEMGRCFDRLATVLKPGGKAAVVVGDSIVRAKVIRNDLLLEEVAERAGFELMFKKERAIPGHRKIFNQSMARLAVEHVLGFRCTV